MPWLGPAEQQTRRSEAMGDTRSTRLRPLDTRSSGPCVDGSQSDAPRVKRKPWSIPHVDAVREGRAAIGTRSKDCMHFLFTDT